MWRWRQVRRYLVGRTVKRGFFPFGEYDFCGQQSVASLFLMCLCWHCKSSSTFILGVYSMNDGPKVSENDASVWKVRDTGKVQQRMGVKKLAVCWCGQHYYRWSSISHVL